MILKNVVLARGLLALTAIAVLTLALISSDFPPKVFEYQSKIQHLIAFFTLAILSDCAFPKARLWKTILPSLILFGISIELFQSFTPARTPRVADVLIDTAGVAGYNTIITFTPIWFNWGV